MSIACSGGAVAHVPGSATDARDLRLVFRFLAMRDVEPVAAGALHRALGASSVDCIVLLASAVLRSAETAFEALRDGLAPLIVISGGQGHSTALLREALSRHPTYADAARRAAAEADMMADVAICHWGLERGQVLVEAESTNCADNAVRSRRLLEKHGLSPRTFLLLQDPTMQRRTDASFRRAWSDAPGARFVNHATPLISVECEGGSLRLGGAGDAAPWSMERFCTLVMGEITRLRDAPGGYGPRGAGYIAHVDLPPDVEAAHARLSRRLAPELGGRPPA